jgi:hypothetical protein
VDPRAGLSVLEKSKIAFSCRDSNPDRPGAILSTLSPFLMTIQYNTIQYKSHYNTVVLEKPMTVPQLVKKLPVRFGIRMLLATFTRACHLSLT